MSPLLKTNEAFCLKDLIDYEENSIANLDVVTTPSMKYVLMAFDKGTSLSPHRAPGSAIVFALDGSASGNGLTGCHFCQMLPCGHGLRNSSGFSTRLQISVPKPNDYSKPFFNFSKALFSSRDT